MDASADLVKDYFDTHSQVYTSWYRPDTPDGHAFLERKERVLECVGEHPGVLLDVGCGSGVLTRELARVATEYIGTDLAPHMVNEAKQRSADLRNVRFHVCDVQQIPLPDQSVDTVTAIGLLEYFTEPHAVVAELRRVLRPGGRMILSLPYLYSPWRLWEQWFYLPLRRAVAPIVPLRTPYLLQHHFYSVSEYRQILEENGFRLTETVFYNFPLLPRPFDVVLPRATTATARLASGLRHTVLRWFGTGFVAVSERL